MHVLICFAWWRDYINGTLTGEKYEKYVDAGKKQHEDLMYSIMIFMSTMNTPYNQIMEMPFRVYNSILKNKAKFEKEKQDIVEKRTKQNIQNIRSTPNNLSAPY